MILEADQALATVLKAKVIGGSAIGVAFDPPNKPWIAALKGPCVNFFLFDIKENTHRRDVMYEEVRNADGVVVARRPPPLRYDLHYTVTVWAPKVLAEHKVLAAVLRCFSGMDVLPRDMLPPGLAELPYEVLVTTGTGAKRGMFLNLGGELKVGFELTVTVPMPALPDRPAAPPVRQSAEIKVNPVPGADPAATVPATETVAGKPMEDPLEDKEKQGSPS